MSRSRIDWPKVLLGIGVTGAAAWGLYRLSTNAQAAPSGGGGAAPPGPAPGPAPAPPGTPFGPPSAAQAAVTVGNTITIDPSQMTNVVPAGTLPAGTVVTMQVVEATPGSATVGAVFVSPPLPQLGTVQVPRVAITSVSGNVVPPTPVQPTPAGGPVLLQPPYALQANTPYRARLELSGLQTMAPAAMVAQQFSSLGFTNVNVYTSVSQLDATWPPAASQGADSGTRWLTGVWPLGNTTVPQPAEVVAVWQG